MGQQAEETFQPQIYVRNSGFRKTINLQEITFIDTVKQGDIRNEVAVPSTASIQSSKYVLVYVGRPLIFNGILGIFKPFGHRFSRHLSL
jgi:hypothetical protein